MTLNASLLQQRREIVQRVCELRGMKGFEHDVEDVISSMRTVCGFDIQRSRVADMVGALETVLKASEVSQIARKDAA